MDKFIGVTADYAVWVKGNERAGWSVTLLPRANSESAPEIREMATREDAFYHAKRLVELAQAKKTQPKTLFLEG